MAQKALTLSFPLLDGHCPADGVCGGEHVQGEGHPGVLSPLLRSRGRLRRNESRPQGRRHRHHFIQVHQPQEFKYWESLIGKKNH